MTGFGRATRKMQRGLLSVEIKSLNSKQLDLLIKLPKEFSNKEYDLRTAIGPKIIRGKVNVFVQFEEATGETAAVQINTSLAKAYFEQLKPLAESLNLKTENLLSTLLQLPAVMQGESVASEEEWVEILKTAEEAVVAFTEFREKEGQETGKALIDSLNKIKACLDQIGEFDAERLTTIRERLRQFAQDNLNGNLPEENRFEQELIYYLEKLDISEEKQRLAQHIHHFSDCMLEQEPNGRKLGFMAQEIGREINTIGSKANHVGIQQLVVEMKNELEKIKEQVLNVL